ncbi:MAG: hypothetical protein ABI430_00040 [Candidatus Taylorbacteria bacterium]
MKDIERPAPLKPLTREQLRARHETGNRNAGLVEDEGMRALERALDDIQKEAGEPAVEPPVNRPMFGSDSVTRSVSYENQHFGSVSVSINDFTMGEYFHPLGDIFTMVVPLHITGQPNKITFSLQRELADGVRLYWAQNGPPKDCTEEDVPTFSIPITWMARAQKDIPSTVDKVGSDIDLVFIDQSGRFILLNISLASIFGRFTLTLNQAYGGQVVRTTPENAQKCKLQSVVIKGHVASVVPLFAEDAYPGADFFRSFKYLAGGVVTSAIEIGASTPLHKCVIAHWEPEEWELPTELQMEGGWQVATVKMFPPSIRYGFLLCEDKKDCFVHFKQLHNRRGKPVYYSSFPHLRKMSKVAVKFEEQPDGKRKATAVRVL